MNDAPSPDQNRRLADQIGQLRDEEGSLDELRALDDDLVPVLLAYRAETETGDAASAETTRRLWARIEAEMDEPDARPDRAARPARRPDRAPVEAAPRSAAWRTAVGVGLLLVVGVLAWLVWSGPGPGLVAEAGTDGATYETSAGDVVRLRPHSRLYRTSEDAPRFRLEGEALFDVSARSAPPFTVEADGAVVRVLGTRFTVQTWTPRPTVFLAEGRVELQNVATGDTAALRPGEAGTIAEDGTVAVQPADARSYVDWLDGQITFDSQPAATVAAELEQHYGIRIRLPDSVATQTLTGRLLLDRRAQVMDDFGRVLGGRFDDADGTFRFRPEDRRPTPPDR
jgi:transmembrane sensor